MRHLFATCTHLPLPSNREDHCMVGKKENLCTPWVWQGLSEKISLWIKFNVGWAYKPYQNPTVWACHMHLRELSSRVLRKLRPQTLKNSDPPGCLEHKDLPKTSDPRKTQIPGCLENSDPQYFSNIATNYKPRAASLPLSHLQKRNFVLQKYRLSGSSHWQNFDNL